jgi:hypothetical protein
VSTPLGEEFIRIRPDARTFRAELEAQVSAALTSVQGQVAAAQTQFKRAAAATATATSPGGVVIPPSVRSVQQQVTQGAAAQATATTKVGNAAKATKAQLEALSNTQRKVAGTTQGVQRAVQQSETALNRYSRGMFAATAASTGFFRAVSFASGAFLVGATVGASIGAAVNEFTQMTQIGATTVQLIKATGGAANVTAEQVDALSKNTLRLTGVDDELVKAGANVLLTFRNIRNEVGQGNDVFNRAARDAADISAVFRTDLRGSALQLGKALQDPVRGVTALRRSGITLSQSQRDLITALVKSGAVLSAQKIILGEVERQVGGAAEAIGKTLPGQLRIMREEALNSLGAYVKQITESKTASDLAAGAATGMADAFGTVRAIVTTTGPALIGLAQGLGRATSAVGGVDTILVAAAAYKAVTISIGLATTAQGLYVAASAGAARAAVVQATAAGTLTARLEAQAAAEITAGRAAQKSLTTMVALSSVFAIGAAASGQFALAAISGGVALAGMATKAIAAVTALRAAGAAVTATSIASAALGGPIGIAAVGVAALAFGMFKLWQNSRNAPGSLNATRAALDGLNKALETNLRLRAAVGTAREGVGLARFDIRAAENALTTAQDALSSTRAAPGSLRFRFLEEQVTAAEVKLRQEQERLVGALRDLDNARNASAASQRRLSTEVGKGTTALQQNINAIRLQQASFAGEGTALGQITGAAAAQRTLEKTRDTFTDLIDSTKGASREANAAVLTILTTLNRLPTKKEIQVIVTLASQGQSVNAILQQLGVVSAGGNEQRRLGVQSQAQVNAGIREEFLRLQGVLKAQRQKFQTIHQEAVARREILRTQRLEVDAARDAVESATEGRDAAIEGLKQAQQGLSDARTNLADTIQRSAEAVAAAISAGRDAVNASVQDAKSNLLDLNRAVSDAIASYMEKTGAASSGMDKRLRALRQQIVRGQGGPETLKAAQEVNFRMTSQAPELDADKLKTQFDDLTDSFVRGRINLASYDKRFAALTRSINIPRFKELFGSNAANEFLDTLRASRQQAVAIAQGPQKIGGAIAQRLIKPLAVVAQATKDIAAARVQAARDIANSKRDLANAITSVTKAEKDIVKANRQLAAAERRLRQAQHKEVQANTRAIAQNTKETKQLRLVIAARDKIDAGTTQKAKPKGTATEDALPFRGRN